MLRFLRVHAALLFAPFFIALSACSDEDLTTNTTSASFTDKEEKLAFLHRYVSHTPGLLDAEYMIIYHDNSHGRLPGPSDWDIRVVAQVAPDSVLAWANGMEEVSEPLPISIWKGLISDASGGKEDQARRSFRGAGRAVTITGRGTVCAHYSTMPSESE